MSKTFSMAGWRIGFAVGNARLIGALDAREVLSRLWRLHADSGRCLAALNGPQDIVEQNRNLYQQAPRRPGRKLRPRRLGIPGRLRPQCSPGRPCRAQFRSLGSLEFSKKLLTHAHVAVAPGVGFGEEGEGFVRIALVENEQRLRQAARGVKKLLAG